MAGGSWTEREEAPAINSSGVAPDDPIPSFLSLRSKIKTRKNAKPAALPQLRFDLTPEPPAPVKPAPAVVKAPAAPDPVREPIVYTVRQLIAELRQHVEGAYSGLISVEGEISNCRPVASGHV